MSSKTENRRINIWINGKEVQNNVKDIAAAYKKLINEQAKMTAGSVEYLNHAKQIKQLRGYMDEHKRQIGSIATSWQKAKQTIMATGFGVLGGNLITTLTTKIGGFFSNIITGAAKLSDQMADIRKTTGMTTEEVEALSSSLSKIDTRTSSSGLREIAIVAGQLGIAKEDVLSFVESIDKAAVALGDEFTGGADEVASVIGKLRNVFGDIKTDNVGEDIMHISNALNELGAAGFATSPVVADFANRIGGVGITIGLTSGQVLGLSATLQELNVSTERGGTAVVKILQKMTTETDKFAAIAGMSVTEFKNLVNTDLYGAFTKVMEGSKKSGTSATALAGIIKELEIQGAGASEVFAKLGGNVDMLNEKVDLASASLLNTDSIMNEFNLKNENLAGQWEKTKKAVAGFAMSIGKALAPALIAIAKGFVNLLDWIKRNSSSLITFVKIIGVSLASMLAYRASLLFTAKAFGGLRTATIAQNIATKANAIASIVAKGAHYLWAAAVMLLQGNLKKASIAMQAFTRATKLSPVGLIVGVVTAAAGAYAFFTRAAKQASLATESNSRVLKNAKEAYAGQVAAINEYRYQLKRAYKTKEDFSTIVAKWNKDIGVKYNASLDATTAGLKEIDKAAKSATKAIIGMAVVSAISNEIKELTEQNIDAVMAYMDQDAALSEAATRLSDRQKELKEIMANPQSQQQINDALKAVSDAQNSLAYIAHGGTTQVQRDLVKQGASVQRQIEYLLGYQDRLKQQLGIDDIGSDPAFDDYVPPTDADGGGGGSDAKSKKLENEYLKVYNKIREGVKDIFKQIGLDHLSEQEKEIKQVKDKYDELIAINEMAQIEIANKGAKATEEELATAKALASQLVTLEEYKQNELDAVRRKWEEKKLIERLEAQEKIRVALMDEEDKAIYDISTKYAELIDLAEKYGFDTVELYNKMQEELDKLADKNKVNTAFGWTDEEWNSFKEKAQKVIGYIQQLSNITSKLAEIENNRDQARLTRLEKYYSADSEKLELMYANKQIGEFTYQRKKKELDSEYDEGKRQIEKRQNERKKQSAEFEAIINTASAAVEALPNPLMVAFALAAGAAQIAAIHSEPEPFESGGYTKKDSSNSRPVGVVHANEWVSPAWMTNSPVTGPMISQLENIRKSGNARTSVSLPQVVRNKAQQGSNDINSAYFADMLDEMKQLREYLGDPNNRTAIIVHDTYTKYQKDIAEMQQLRKIS